MRRLGVGAKVSCLSRFIHASQRDQLYIVVQHESCKMNEDEYIKLYAIKRYWKVTEEGESDYFFNGMAGEGKTQEEIQVPLPEEVVQAAEDVNH